MSVEPLVTSFDPGVVCVLWVVVFLYGGCGRARIAAVVWFSIRGWGSE